MSTMKIVWMAVLAGLFFAFSVWYGGNGKPIDEAEAEQLLSRIEAAYSDRKADQGNFIANMVAMLPNDDGREFYAVNLENLKDGDAAEAADRAYAALVMPLLFERASHPVFVSETAGLMLGEYGNEVDRVAVVRYRSLRDMIDMTLDPAMTSGSDDKFAALNHTEVFITRPVISFMQVRIVVGLVLLVIGLLGLVLWDRLTVRRESTVRHDDVTQSA